MIEYNEEGFAKIADILVTKMTRKELEDRIYYQLIEAMRSDKELFELYLGDYNNGIYSRKY